MQCFFQSVDVLVCAQFPGGERYMAKIVIVGGGTAGWLSAAYLSARLKTVGDESDIDITLIEASDIPPIGVGESTVPPIRDTLANVGVSERDFMRACDATFKHGIRFVNWLKSPQEDPNEYYFHPFERPFKVGADSLAGYWLRGVDPYKRNFADAVSIQQEVAIRNLAPKRTNDPGYAAPMPYAYHLDAGKLAVMLKKIALGRSVKHVIGKVSRVHNDPTGRMDSVELDDGRALAADVFIDCSGFAGLLIEKHYKEPFIDLNHVLFCDKAVTCQVPNEPNAVFRPYTTATAQTAGWIWDIGLSTRRGIGHVYSSQYQDSDAAEKTLRDYIGPAAEGLSARHLDMRVGYRKQQWINNCIAVGLSSGFIEPLESTGIALIEVALEMLAQMIPRYLNGGAPQPRFNEIMQDHYELVIEFIKLHYFLSERTDSQFWIDNTADASATEALLDKLKSWEAGYPDVYDLKHLHSIFDHLSYQYVFFGMGRRPTVESRLGNANVKSALEIFNNVKAGLGRAIGILPDHRAYIEANSLR